jgi:signal transduction histidine kinase/sensor domain CHASE-containing protein
MPSFFNTMSIKFKAMLVFLCCCIVLLAGEYALCYWILLPSYSRLEAEFVCRNVIRVQNAINGEFDNISSTAKDWSNRDDMYGFFKTRDSAFVSANLSDDAIATIRITTILFILPSGALLYGKCIDPVHKSNIPLSGDALTWFAGRTDFLRYAFASGEKRGIVLTPNGPMLAVSRPVLHSSGKGMPNGSIVMGRLLDSTEMARLAKSLNISLSIQPLNVNALNPCTGGDFLVMANKGTPFSFLDPKRKGMISGCAGLKTIDRRTSLFIQVDMPRTIYQEGSESISWLILYGAFAVFVFFLIFWILLEHILINRLLKLKQEMAAVSDLGRRISVRGYDEIGLLGRKINDMLSQLELSQHEINLHHKEMISMLENNPSASILINETEGTISWVNRNASQVFKTASGQIVGCHWKYFLHPGLVQSDTAAGVLTEGVALRPDGSEFPVLASAMFLDYKGLRHRLIAFFDISRLKELETQLSRLHKMETIGLLAGGVAHDLNNMLNPLIGYPEIMKRHIAEGDPMFKFIDKIEISARKAAAIVSDLLTLARRAVVKEEVLSLNQLVENYMATPEFEKTKFYHPQVTYYAKLSADLLTMKGSPIQVSKAIMNLVSNASEAILGQGEVTISTSNRILDKDLNGYEKITAGEYVALTVTDTGTGIADADLNKIFEPFYSKKIMGRSGTGLGMSIVWNAVKDHRGFVNIISSRDSGTTIDLFFPVCREKLPVVFPPATLDQYFGKGYNVLVIDDMKEQRDIVTAMLCEIGYRVNTVSGGEEGIEFLKKQSADVVICDMIMDPGIDGLDTLTRIKMLRKDQKVIIATGYSETVRVTKAIEMGAYYLKKPYQLEELGIALKSVLTSPGH